MSIIWVGGSGAVLVGLQKWNDHAAFVFHLFLAYSCLALHDLLRHAWAVESAARRGDLEGARTAIARLVGRDTDRMDISACRRAAIESLSENLTDGFVSPLAWYVVLGLPGIVLFKVVSTMDSMVGYKTPRYLKFGWCGARLDDLMNFIPARLTWLLLSLLSLVFLDAPHGRHFVSAGSNTRYFPDRIPDGAKRLPRRNSTAIDGPSGQRACLLLNYGSVTLRIRQREMLPTYLAPSS